MADGAATGATAFRVNPNSAAPDDPESMIREAIDAARRHYNNAAALEDRRDRALHECLYAAAIGLTHAWAHPQVFARIVREAGGVRGRDIAAQFIDLITHDANGGSVLNHDRRSQYAGAAAWMATPTLCGAACDAANIDMVIGKAIELGGIDGVAGDENRPGIAFLYRQHRDRLAGKTGKTRAKAKPSAAADDAEAEDSESEQAEDGRYWRTPPDRYQEWQRRFGFDDIDLFPYPLPPGYDALGITFPPGDRYLNIPFSSRDEAHGRPITDVLQKIIDEHRRHHGQYTYVIPFPIDAAHHLLVEAGARIHPVKPRVAWLDTQTGKPHPSPPNTALFVLESQEQASADTELDQLRVRVRQQQAQIQQLQAEVDRLERYRRDNPPRQDILAEPIIEDPQEVVTDPADQIDQHMHENLSKICARIFHQRATIGDIVTALRGYHRKAPGLNPMTVWIVDQATTQTRTRR